ncbi:energy transducer TonB [Niveispirillum sp. BGYR6]|uniref:energy transducer TonB n=1 Tax=Niveispirillum sp. BGYR6 TaxID=2971249 RepID=UPI0022B99356|nr:energy transducer TonB [Niveispirillum sp. BGYR6]MDG5496479.1 energy transducer TonB [Niveispirillum sp. BGYR6]
MAWKAAELYEQNPNYRAENHAQLLINAIDLAADWDKSQSPGAARRALADFRRRAGEKDPLVIQFQERLAKAYYDVGRFTDGEDAFDQVLVLTANLYGDKSPQYMMALLSYARTSKGTRNIVRTRELLNKASEIAAVLPVNHPVRLSIDIQHAQLTLDDERYEEARQMFQGIIDQSRTNTDPRSQKDITSVILSAYGKLIYIAHKQGDNAQEDALVEKTREIPFEEELFPLFRSAPDTDFSAGVQLSGKVRAVFKVSTADGKVKQIEIAEQKGNPQFAERVKKALLEWRFKPSAPAGTAGTLVEMEESFDYQFQNDKPDTGTRLKRRI